MYERGWLGRLFSPPILRPPFHVASVCHGELGIDPIAPDIEPDTDIAGRLRREEFFEIHEILFAGVIGDGKDEGGSSRF